MFFISHSHLPFGPLMANFRLSIALHSCPSIPQTPTQEPNIVRATVRRSIEEGFIEKQATAGTGCMLVATLANDRLVFCITNLLITLAYYLRRVAVFPCNKNVYNTWFNSKATLALYLNILRGGSLKQWFSLCTLLNTVRLITLKSRSTIQEKKLEKKPTVFEIH